MSYRSDKLMKKTMITLMIFTILTKVLGFFRDIVLSYYYGVSNISDAYIIAITIPSVIFSLIGIGIATSYIPIYTDIEKMQGKSAANSFSNNLINVCLLSGTLLIFIVLMSPETLVRIFASGFDDETMSLAVSFTRVTIFSINISILIYIIKGYLNANNSFNAPAVMSIPLNLVIILSIFLSSRYNILLLPFGNLLAMFFQFLFVLYFAFKSGYRYKPIVDFKNPYLKKILLLSVPVILGTSVSDINVIIDRTLASNLVTGGIAALDYSDKVNVLVQGIFVISISTVLFPRMSKMISEDDTVGFVDLISEAIIMLSFFIIPATFVFLFFSRPIVGLLFGRGAFDAEAITLTANLLFFYTFGMIGIALREIFSKAFYAMQDTKTPMINASIGMVINITLNLILSRIMGISGLALATSIASILTAVFLGMKLRKRAGYFLSDRIAVNLGKILVCSISMTIITRTSYIFLTRSIGSNISLMISIGLGVVIYLIMALITKVEGIDKLKEYFKKAMD